MFIDAKYLFAQYVQQSSSSFLIPQPLGLLCMEQLYRTKISMITPAFSRPSLFPSWRSSYSCYYRKEKDSLREKCNAVHNPDTGLNNVYQTSRGTESSKTYAKTVLAMHAFEALLWKEFFWEASTGVTFWKTNHKETWLYWETTSESQGWAVQEVQLFIPTTESFWGEREG